MPAVDKLLLEEALQDSPQTRSLLSVFEEDAGTLTDYTNQLLQAMQRVYGAQNEMCLATQQLSKQLLAYEKQNFALGKGDEEVISTLHCFSKVVDELNVLHTELAKQLADTMVLPIIQFREKDLTEVSTLKDLFGLASNEHDLSMAKYSRLPKKKENEKAKTEVVKEVAAARRKQHLSSLQYYCALNALQYRKRVAMMEPMIGFAHGQGNNPPGRKQKGKRRVDMCHKQHLQTDLPDRQPRGSCHQVESDGSPSSNSHYKFWKKARKFVPQFELTSVTQFAAHQENKRLVGFVVRTPESTGGEALSTYIFESNSEGEKICYAINLGKEIIEVQKDPEALAQLMLSIPLTNDGKYVLLNDQPDDSDGSPSENRGAESEA
uniref:Adaptor protein, phosphotyrosine interacting with PH domain and leucine zipper 2 n=1 Tax=Canis lupus familiaris TaxID=9615 RepID=A0A8C0S0R5_CANLF